MRKDKKAVFTLRKNGKSYKDIEKIMNIPRSTLSSWFKDEEWSQVLKNELQKVTREQHTQRFTQLNRTRGIALKKLYVQSEREAVNDLEVLKFHPLFVAGLMLYWGEGDRVSKGLVRMSNIEPRLLVVFIAFLVEVCGVPKQKISAAILVYPDLDEKTCREYWSKNIDLPEEQFRKSVTVKGRHQTNRLRYGVCTVYITSSYLKKKIMKWLELLPDELLKGDYYANI
ncbi:hypothetical protein COU15_00605 [Candidatus Kaiserbacteria bacterium CG10_big_fil_rev_8_21_14_0_10_45_20]|uniref:Uncharacterized protein n=1 Tax=Candidatus Kaiserbacteria bacterium CG10_big_fil_rev_8_21_14_0_10_45_20 TaxID=1974607 RepID=A0A2H0UGF4_9BACT|nr:MAG: hypothetical protein COU15_00605 [Candidatus Kaiserbacteria bacterium CG10_big_fil_rev_8_21_14_0_10_45_20]